MGLLDRVLAPISATHSRQPGSGGPSQVTAPTPQQIMQQYGGAMVAHSAAPKKKKGRQAGRKDSIHQPLLKAWGWWDGSVNSLKAKYGPSWMMLKDDEGRTLIHVAAARGWKDTVRELAPHIPVNVVDSAFRTPLHWAVRAGETETVKVLIGAGANIGVADSNGMAPLDIALQGDDSDMTQMMIETFAENGSQRRQAESAPQQQSAPQQPQASPTPTERQPSQQRSPGASPAVSRKNSSSRLVFQTSQGSSTMKQPEPAAPAPAPAVAAAAAPAAAGSPRAEGSTTAGEAPPVLPTVDPTKWRIPFEELSDLSLHAAGAFGSVYKAKLRGAIDVAAKQLRNWSGVEEHECKIMAAMPEHPALVKFYGVSHCESGERKGYYVVTAFEQYSSLDNYLERLENADQKLTDKDMLAVAESVRAGLEILHEHDIIHRDIALRNILVHRPVPNLEVKICDFGLSKSSHYYYSRDKQIPYQWLPPESLTKGRYSEKSDVWMYAVMLWELYSGGEIPWVGVDVTPQFIVSLQRGERLKKPEDCPERMYEVMKKCWSNSPRDRPTFEDLKSDIAELLAAEESGSLHQPVPTPAQASKQPTTVPAPEEPGAHQALMYLLTPPAAQPPASADQAAAPSPAQPLQPSPAHAMAPAAFPLSPMSPPQDVMCIVCSQSVRDALFEPCRHLVCCHQCADMVLKSCNTPTCLECSKPITSCTVQITGPRTT